MNNAGIDWGATYSVISHLVKDTPQAVEPYEGGCSPCRDSLVVVDDRCRVFCGIKARNRLGQEKVSSFRGFKMLLGECDEKKLKERGYTGNFTPEKVAELHIYDLLDRYSDENLGGGSIDNLVVGAPEIWFNTPELTRCRNILMRIISAHPKVKNLRIVSEPALACAYFIHNYKVKSGKNFKGNALIIDYGGGTLDAALCRVESISGGSQVTVIKRSGAGDCGGMLYLESVLDAALGEKAKKDADYHACICQIEETLMINGDEVKDTLSLAKDDGEILNEVFKTLTYAGKKREITYKHLKDAFDKSIRPVLEKTLSEMTAFIKENGIENVYVVPVGGFCNFCLVSDLIENTPGLCRFGKGDKRYKDLSMPKRECERAISYGAALVANGVVRFKQLSPYTLSIVAAGKDGKPDFGQSFETIKAGQEIFELAPVMAKADGREVMFLARSIPYLRVDFEGGMFKCLPPAIPIELPRDNVLKLGFSLDQSATVHLHVVDMGPMGRDFNPKGKGKALPPLPLSDIYSIFGGLIALEEEKK